MHKMRHLLSIIRVLTVLTMLASATYRAPAQGMKFNGSECSIAERTGYSVFDRHSPTFSHLLKMEFRMQTYPEEKKGYIFRLYDKANPDAVPINLHYDGELGKHRFKLNLENIRILISMELPRKENAYPSEWLNVTLALNLDRDSVILQIDGHKEAAGLQFEKKYIRPVITFGKNGYQIDVPTIAIKELSVGDRNREFHFKLDEEQGGYVHESSSGRKMGKVENPVWLSQDYFLWRIQDTYNSPTFLCKGYDVNRHEIWAYDRDSIRFFNIRTGQTRTAGFDGTCPVEISTGQNFLAPESGKFYAYEPYNDSDSGKISWAVLDTVTWKWEALGNRTLDMPVYHHGEWIDEDGGKFMIYGGFGNEKFNGDIYRFDLRSHEWENTGPITGERPWPRYFCATGYCDSDSCLYIYGGMGNESGYQVVGRSYLYDLYKVNTKTLVSKKIWSINWDRDSLDCVPARNMILDGNGCFYVLCYPEYMTRSSLQLYRFSIDDGSKEAIGSRIPIMSDKINTNAALYYDSELKKLVALTEETPDDRQSIVSAYTIEYPPAVRSDRYAAMAKERRARIFALSGTILAIIATYGAIHIRILRKKRRLRLALHGGATHRKSRIQVLPEGPDQIRMFGNMLVRDMADKDITVMLTEKIKQVFILILYSSEKGGISSKNISSLVWPEKDEEKAKNIRGVTLNSLRKILNRIDGISLVFNEGKYTIQCSEPAVCDWIECRKELESREKTSDRLLSILSRGKFLERETDPFYDRIKEDMEDAVTAKILKEAENRFMSEDYANLMLCTEIIFRIDPLNEFAMNVAVKSLVNTGQEEEAKVKYNQFISRYRKDMDEDYPLSFEQIILS